MQREKTKIKTAPRSSPFFLSFMLEFVRGREKQDANPLSALKEGREDVYLVMLFADFCFVTNISCEMFSFFLS